MSLDVHPRRDLLHFRQRLHLPANLKNLVSKIKKAVHGHGSSSPSGGGHRNAWIPLLSCSNPLCENRGNCSCPPPAHVPHGFVAVYAGREKKRFVIPATYLNHPVFRLLLEKSEEEFGINHNGPLNIPFELVSFERLLSLIGQEDAFPPKEMNLRELEQYYRDKFDITLEIIDDMGE